MPAMELAGLISAIRSAIDIVKESRYTHDDQRLMRAQTELLEELIGIHQTALSLQDQHAALVSENAELQKRLAESDKWDEVKSGYRLLEVQNGKFVYSLKSPQVSPEPIHWLCANCFEDRKKSILQAVIKNDFDALYACPRCKTNLYLHFKDYPSQSRKRFRLFGKSIE